MFKSITMLCIILVLGAYTFTIKQKTQTEDEALALTETFEFDDRTTLALCRELLLERDRLGCYDALEEQIAVATQEPIQIASVEPIDLIAKEPEHAVLPGTSAGGKWFIETTISPIDDSSNITLRLAANEIIKSGYRTAEPMLVVACAENKTSVGVDWGLYLGAQKTRVLTRFDQSKAQSADWQLAPDNSTVLVPGAKIAFARLLMTHDRLLTLTTPFGAEGEMVTFDLAELPQAIKPLREACHW